MFCGNILARCFISTMVLAISGCSSVPLGDRETRLVEERAQVSKLVREREEHLVGLRAELASLRIDAAKKGAELEDLHEQVEKLKHQYTEARKGLVEARQSADTARSELDATRTERDQLLRAKSELQAQVAEIPLLKQRAAVAQSGESAVQSQFKEVRDGIAALAVQLEQVKHEQAKQESVKQPVAPMATKPTGQKSRGKASVIPLSPPPADPAGAPLPRFSAQSRSTPPVSLPDSAPNPAPDGLLRMPSKRVLVRPGDTLVSLAQASGVSPDSLKRINRLTEEQLLVGQVLLIPKPTTP